MGHLKPDLLLKFFGFDPPFKSQLQKKCLPGIFPLLFFHRSPRKYPKGLSLKFGVCQTWPKKVTRPKISNFGSLQRPLMTSEVNQLVLSFIGIPRAFQNGAALVLLLKIQAPRAKREIRLFSSQIQVKTLTPWNGPLKRFLDPLNGPRGRPQRFLGDSDKKIPNLKFAMAATETPS